MKKLERTVYLLVILSLVSFSAYTFSFYTRHYAYIEEKFDIVFAHCPPVKCEGNSCPYRK